MTNYISFNLCQVGFGQYDSDYFVLFSWILLVETKTKSENSSYMEVHDAGIQKKRIQTTVTVHESEKGLSLLD